MCLHDEKNKVSKEATILNFRRYGRGGRDWPYHLDPSLAHEEEVVSGTGDEVDTDAFGV